jgi:hypothetical protein
VIGASCVTTFTSGLYAFSVSFAETTFGGRRRRLVQDLALQVRQVDDVEVDEADRADAASARYSATGEPRPPAPTTSTFALRRSCADPAADLPHDDVPRVAHHLAPASARTGRLLVIIFPSGAAAGERGDDRHLVAVWPAWSRSVQVVISLLFT